MYTVVFPNRHTTLAVKKRVPIRNRDGEIAGVGTKEIFDGQDELLYEISLDVALLDQMARKAAKNNSGISKQGPLKVRVVERRKL